MHISCTAMFGHVGFDPSLCSLPLLMGGGKGGGRPEVLILGLRENGCQCVWGGAPFRLSRQPEDAGAASDAWQAQRFTPVGLRLRIPWVGALHTDPSQVPFFNPPGALYLHVCPLLWHHQAPKAQRQALSSGAAGFSEVVGVGWVFSRLCLL